MSAQRLDPQKIQQRLAEISGWGYRNEKLHRDFQFKDFAQAFRFMTLAAEHAERLDHHPEWSNVFNKVNVQLTTHSAQGVSNLDFQLALAMNQCAERATE